MHSAYYGSGAINCKWCDPSNYLFVFFFCHNILTCKKLYSPLSQFLFFGLFSDVGPFASYWNCTAMWYCDKAGKDHWTSKHSLFINVICLRIVSGSTPQWSIVIYYNNFQQLPYMYLLKRTPPANKRHPLEWVLHLGATHPSSKNAAVIDFWHGLIMLKC